MEQQSQNVVSLESLSIEQLQSLHRRVSEETEFLTDSCQQLKIVHNRFGETAAALDVVSEPSLSTPALIPLTGALYAPGTIADASTVTLDIGTGYYVEMNVAAARDYLSRKQKFLTDQIDNVQKAASEKLKTRVAITTAIESKLQGIVAEQQKSAPGTLPSGTLPTVKE